ncbi:MAG: AIPR family protein [Candidatus Cybelea sp.]
MAHNADITLYDRRRIAAEYIDLETDPGIKGAFSFTCSDIKPLEYAAKSTARLFLFPALATELVNLQGIADGSLFSQNVRLALGNTKVNKDIQTTISDKAEHAKFPLFHNGITLICRQADFDGPKLTVTDYAVVNGAQSLTSLYKQKANITSDLRILTRVVETRGDIPLARQITTNSNNQNAIKPRDSRSNHVLQTRLKAEFEANYAGKIVYEVKRGEHNPDGVAVITNEEAGRLLLAFDCEEPWASHQVYKIFDDEYAKIFGRPEVDAHRIVFLYRTMQLIEEHLGGSNNKAFSRYTISRFFLLYILKKIFMTNEAGQKIVRNPRAVVAEATWEKYASIVEEILKGTIVDLDYEISRDGASTDYKSDLKSPSKAAAIAQEVLRTYEKDVAREKAPPVSQLEGLV